MATVYYKRLKVATIDSDGTYTDADGQTINVHNVTQDSTLGTLVVDADSYLPEGSFTADEGDIIELSHDTYLETVRLRLAATQEDAYFLAENAIATFVLENNIAGANDSRTGDIYAIDESDPTARPIYLGAGEAGKTAVIPIAQGASIKNLSLKIVSKDIVGQQSVTALFQAPSAAIEIPAAQSGTASIFDRYEDATTTGTSSEDIYTDLIPANTLANVGDKLEVLYAGILANGGNDKEITVRFGDDILSIATTLNGDWSIDIDIIRSDTDEARYTAVMRIGSDVVGTTVGVITDLDFETDIDLVLVAHDADASGDTLAMMGYCIYYPAASVDETPPTVGALTATEQDDDSILWEMEEGTDS